MTTCPPAPKEVPQLAAKMPAGEGVRSILRQLFAALEAQEEGTRAGLDPECLHDFRVAVRRTRSVLGQLKQALPVAALEHFRPEFAWLGEVTGPTRDLDVYLLRFPDYRDSLPPEVHDHLQPLHQFLLAHRQIEQARLLNQLDSERYQQWKRQWREFLAAPAGDPPPGWAQQELRNFADDRIIRALRKVFSQGRAIDQFAPADDLHELRKSCKKLRYLLEFFQPLYSGKALGRLIQSLKGLQDHLGEFQDLQVQSEALRSFSEQMIEEGEVPPRTLVALGMLVEGLRSRQRRVRKGFTKCFSHFDRTENHRLLEQLQARKSLVETLNAAKEKLDGKLSQG